MHTYDSLMQDYVNLQHYNAQLRKTVETMQLNEKELAKCIDSQQDLIDSLNDKIKELELLNKTYRDLMLRFMKEAK